MSCVAFLPTASPLWHGMIALQRPADPLDDRTAAVVAWVEHLLQEGAYARRPCPRCGRTGHLAESLSHLLCDHGAGFAEAAAWLEAADPDLHALAVHYLVVKDRGSAEEAPRPEGRSSAVRECGKV